jgi:hypothetical protein
LNNEIGGVVQTLAALGEVLDLDVLEVAEIEFVKVAARPTDSTKLSMPPRFGTVYREGNIWLKKHG